MTSVCNLLIESLKFSADTETFKASVKCAEWMVIHRVDTWKAITETNSIINNNLEEALFNRLMDVYYQDKNVRNQTGIVKSLANLYQSDYYYFKPFDYINFFSKC